MDRIAREPMLQGWSREKLPDGRTVFIVRHDRIPGGTKALVLPGMLKAMGGDGPAKFSYASPSWGHAQHAIAESCRGSSYEAHIFVPARREKSLPTKLAGKAGAVLHEVRPGYLKVVQKRQEEWHDENPGAIALPFGLEMPEMSHRLTVLARGMNPPGRARIWVAAGSGTLWRALSKAWKGNAFGVVQVGKDVDFSTLRRCDLKFVAPEKFERPAKQPPPFQSARNYDAKVWQFILEHGRDGDLFWNVAG